MSDLSAFINPAYNEKKVEIEVSDRFVNEDGSIAKVVIRALTQEEIQYISKRSTHEVTIAGTKIDRLDEDEFLNRCLLQAVVFPDLTNRELCLKCKTEDPVLVPVRLFLADEYKKVSSAFAALCGLDDYKDLSSIGEVTKN
jgi:hypothetical protein